MGSIVAQAWLIPLLLDDLGAENVSNVAWGSTLLIAGVGFAIISIQQSDWLTGIAGGLFLAILGAAWGISGMRAILKQAFGTPPPEKKSQRRSR
jgi:thiol:disulfide interchange protein